MREVSRRIRSEQSVLSVEGNIATVGEVFTLTACAELEQASGATSRPPVSGACARHRRLAWVGAWLTDRGPTEVHARRARAAASPAAGLDAQRLRYPDVTVVRG